MTRSGLRSQCTCTTSASPWRRARLRSMLMIGVIPLPALMNSGLRGAGSGSTNVPSTPPRRTTVPGRARSSRKDETVPPSTSLGVTVMRPSQISGSEVSE